MTNVSNKIGLGRAHHGLRCIVLKKHSAMLIALDQDEINSLSHLDPRFWSITMHYHDMAICHLRKYLLVCVVEMKPLV